MNESKIMEVIKVLCVLRVFKVLKVTRVLKVVGPEGLRNHNSDKHNKTKDNQSLHSAQLVSENSQVDFDLLGKGNFK